MKIQTHRDANNKLIGSPIEIKDDAEAIVKLLALDEMKVDNHGLIHGGFTFGLADYAAMLAVNHPNVVLGASDVRFLAPVKVGDLMKAYAEIKKWDGKRREVSVNVYVEEVKVLSGKMNCFILDSHVLNR